jgi:hypothetical protein
MGGAVMSNVTNLDCMSREELMAFWLKYRGQSRKRAEELVGKRDRYVSIANTLAAYAVAKAVAIQCRLDGSVDRAEVYERHCEIHYDNLPDDIKW